MQQKRWASIVFLAALTTMVGYVSSLYAEEPAVDGYLNAIETPKTEKVLSKNAKAKLEGDSQRFKIQKLEFKKAKLVDVMRTISEISNINIVPTKTAGETEITVYLRNVTVHEAVDTISRSNGLWYRQDKISNAYRVMTTKEYQSDMVVFRDDTTEIFNLLHPNPVIVATVIQDIYGDRVIMTLGVEDDTGLNGLSGMGGGMGNRSGSSMGGSSRSNGGIGSNRGSSRNSSSRNSSSRGFTSRQTGGSGRRGVNIISERAISEDLTPEQLSRLDAAVEASDEPNSVNSEALVGLSRTEQPIYVTVNREHNLIIVRTSDMAAMREIERLIKDMDRPTPQVLLEMKVLELSSGDSFRQTFSLTGVSGDGNESLGLGNFPAEGGTLVYNYINSVISARLELLERNNQINTLSSPILLASNNKPSQVFVGEERVIVTGVDVSPATAVNGVVVSSVAVPVTEVRNIGNTLLILPKINADKTVTLVVQQDTSSVNIGGGSLPVLVGNNVQNFSIDTVNTSNIQGTVVAKDGLTVAIGGLINHRDSNLVQKVPFISEIPVFGQLFQRKEQIKSKSELILLITPHIITNPSETENVTYDNLEDISEQVW
jgi:type II secretory pathway component GspD/PulD (secretin)